MKPNGLYREEGLASAAHRKKYADTKSYGMTIDLFTVKTP